MEEILSVQCHTVANPIEYFDMHRQEIIEFVVLALSMVTILDRIVNLECQFV